MNLKKILIIFSILSILLLICSSSVYAEDDRSYNIDKAVIHLFVGEDGLLHVSETYTYTFKGSFNGIYRDIPLKKEESIKNIKVTTPGVYNKVEITDGKDEKKLKIYLHPDSGKTMQISDTTVDITIEYDFYKLLKNYEDVGVLSYKLWGENWDQKVDKLDAYINFKSNKDVKYWINPGHITKSSNWVNSTTLHISADGVDTGTWYELRAAIPINQFAPNAPYATHNTGDALPTLEAQQKKYEDDQNFKRNFYGIIAVILLLSLAIPVGLYLKYGREPEIDYIGEYEREPPTNDSPAIVNALYTGDTFKSIGSVNVDAYISTIMDLIDRGYLSFNTHEKDIEEIVDNKITIDSNNGEILINEEKDFSELEYYENKAIDLLKSYSAGSSNVISLDVFHDRLNEEEGANEFKNNFNDWKNDFESYVNDNILAGIFTEEGSTPFLGYGLLAILIGIAIGINYSFASNPLDVEFFLFIVGIILVISGIIIMFLPNYVIGKWTVNGATNNEKWKKFKRFLTDFSLIKEYPPESVILWNKYLVYGAALGVADKVHESMESLVPQETISKSDMGVYMFYSFGYSSMYSSMNTGINFSDSSDSFDFGDVGGGSGGGGGGAF